MIATLPAGQEAFTPEKIFLSWTQYLDGGGSLAVDRHGAVFVAWHGRGDSKLEGEQGREIFMSVSIDGGKTFSREQAVSKTLREFAPAVGCASMSTRRMGFTCSTEGLRELLAPWFIYILPIVARLLPIAFLIPGISRPVP